jgi:hypothetical protein
MSEELAGYGKPPQQHQFKPGESGNPAGYPEGKPNRGTVARKFLQAPIHYKDPSTGQYVLGTIEESMVLAMMAAATNGDVNAYREIMDSVYGKVTDKVQVETTRKITRRIGGRTPEPPADGSPGT